MKKAEEIYAALEEVYEDLKSVTTSTAEVINKAEAIKSFAEIKDKVDTREEHDALDNGVSTFASILLAEAEDLDELICRARAVADIGLSEPEAVEDHVLTEEELREKYRDKHTNIEVEMVEDKQHILNLLLPALRYTRAGENVKALQDNMDGTMLILFKTGATKKVNIDCDSGIAMIIDVCRALM